MSASKELIDQAVKSLRFAALPLGRWQVVWHGDVGFPSRRECSSQPSITVALRQFQTRNGTGLADARVSVGQLFALPLGSVWEDKVLVETSHPDAETRHIDVDPSVFRLAKAGVPLEDGTGHLLPFSEFPFHSGHTSSWVLYASIGCEIVIVPATELARFYFGSSAALIKRLFSSNFNVEDLVTEFDLSDEGRAKITLAEGLPGASAVDIARMLFDDSAERAALLIGRALVSDAAEGARCYPRCAFPFFKPSTLHVEGISLKCEAGPSRFLVTRIVQCFATLPFSKLHYVCATKRASRGHAGSEAAGGRSASEPRRSPPSMRPRAELQDRDARAGTVRRTVAFSSERFVDLRRKPVRRLDGRTERAVYLPNLIGHSQYSTADPGTSKGPTAMDLLSAEEALSQVRQLRCPHSQWQAFFGFLSELLSERWVTRHAFVPLSRTQVAAHLSRLPEMVDEDGVVLDSSRPLEVRRHGLLVSEMRPSCFLNVVTIDGTNAALASLCPDIGGANILYWWPRVEMTPHRALCLVADALTDSASSSDFYMIDVPEQPRLWPILAKRLSTAGMHQEWDSRAKRARASE